MRGRQFLFEDQLDRIRNRLKQTLIARAVRTHAHLHPRQCAAFVPGQVGKAHQQDQAQHKSFDYPFKPDKSNPLLHLRNHRLTYCQPHASRNQRHTRRDRIIELHQNIGIHTIKFDLRLPARFHTKILRSGWMQCDRRFANTFIKQLRRD